RRASHRRPWSKLSCACWLLARRPAGLRPDAWVTSRVQHREDNHALGFGPIEDGIRETGHECAAYLTVDLREHLRIALEGIQDGTDSSKKPLAQPFRLPFVVPKPSCKIPPNLPAEDNRQRHQRRRASASTWSLEIT